MSWTSPADASKSRYAEYEEYWQKIEKEEADEVEEEMVEKGLEVMEWVDTLPGMNSFPRRFLYDKQDPVYLFNRPKEFEQIYGMKKESYRYVLSLIHDDLEPKDVKCTSIPPYISLSIFLEFARTNAFRRTIASLLVHQVADSTVTKIRNKVAKVLAKLAAEVFVYELKLSRM